MSSKRSPPPTLVLLVFLLLVFCLPQTSLATGGRIIRLIGGITLIGGVRLAGTSPVPRSGGGSGCSQATQFLNRVSVDSTHQAAYTTMICGLVTDGVWSQLDLLYLLATQNSSAALTNLVNSTFSVSAVGSPSFTADVGYATSTAANYLNFGWAGTNGPNWAQTSASFGGWSGGGGQGCGAFLGTNDSTGDIDVDDFCDSTPTTTLAVINQEVWDSKATSAGETSSLGFWAVSRTGSTSQLYYDGAATGTANTITYSDAPTSADFVTDPGGNTDTQGIAVMYAGGYLTSTQETDLYNRIHTFLNAINPTEFP